VSDLSPLGLTRDYVGISAGVLSDQEEIDSFDIEKLKYSANFCKNSRNRVRVVQLISIKNTRTKTRTKSAENGKVPKREPQDAARTLSTHSRFAPTRANCAQTRTASTNAREPKESRDTRPAISIPSATDGALSCVLLTGATGDRSLALRRSRVTRGTSAAALTARGVMGSEPTNRTTERNLT
jgi:hypothetical protein